MSQTLARIRKLLPVFESSDLNVMLKVQKTFGAEPGATVVMKKALGLPLPLTSKLTSVQGHNSTEYLFGLRLSLINYLRFHFDSYSCENYSCFSILSR